MSKHKSHRKQKDFTEEEEYIEPQSELDNWKVVLPSLISDLAECDEDSKKNIISKINNFLTLRPIGSFINPYVDELINNLHDSIFNPSNIEEHDEALFAICNTCANTYGSFEQCGIALINELLPTLDRAFEEESLKLYDMHCSWI